jgi:mRNA turnover protein 4
MEPQLRKLGLHTSLKKGIVWLEKEHTICKEHEKLNPEQARLLVMMDILNRFLCVKINFSLN